MSKCTGRLVIAVISSFFLAFFRSGQETGEECRSILLLRHGIRYDGVVGSREFYANTDRPWDSPLHRQWVESATMSDNVRNYVNDRILGKGAIVSYSPLTRTRQTAELLKSVASPNKIRGSLAVDLCASETLPSIKNHIRKSGFANNNMSILPNKYMDDENALSSCRLQYFWKFGNADFTHNCDGHLSQFECFVKRLVLPPALTRHVVVTHRGSARRICQELSGGFYKCVLNLLNEMDAHELVKCEGDSYWRYVATLRFPGI